MKRIIALMMVSGIALGSFAQKSTIRGNAAALTRPATSVNTGKARTVVIVPRGGFYSPYGYSPFGYSYGYYPMYGYGFGFGYASPEGDVPSKLDLEIEQIKSDYHHEIVDTRHDNSLSKSERKQKIRDIKHERDDAIIGAKQDYYNGPNERNE